MACKPMKHIESLVHLSVCKYKSPKTKREWASERCISNYIDGFGEPENI